MHSPKVTVIIPVYNTEEYAAQTLETILTQTLREIEIIVINDGSTDGSLGEIERVAAADERVTIISQQNAGLSTTRNNGVAIATGEYLYFMDSDDLLEADTLELCYAKCTDERLDFVIFDADTFGDPVPNNPWFDYHRTQYFDDKVYDGGDLMRQMVAKRCYKASACLSFIRTSYLKQMGLEFYPGVIHEDELFTALLYLNASRVGLIHRSFFKRRIRGGSIMTTRFSERNMTGYITVLKELRHAAKARGVEFCRTTSLVTSYILNPTLRNAWQLPFSLRWHLFKEAITRHPHEAKLKSLAILILKKPIRKIMGK